MEKEGNGLSFLQCIVLQNLIQMSITQKKTDVIWKLPDLETGTLGCNVDVPRMIDVLCRFNSLIILATSVMNF